MCCFHRHADMIIIFWCLMASVLSPPTTSPLQWTCMPTCQCADTQTTNPRHIMLQICTNMPAMHRNSSAPSNVPSNAPTPTPWQGTLSLYSLCTRHVFFLSSTLIYMLFEAVLTNEATLSKNPKYNGCIMGYSCGHPESSTLNDNFLGGFFAPKTS